MANELIREFSAKNPVVLRRPYSLDLAPCHFSFSKSKSTDVVFRPITTSNKIQKPEGIFSIGMFSKVEMKSSAVVVSQRHNFDDVYLESIWY